MLVWAGLSKFLVELGHWSKYLWERAESVELSAGVVVLVKGSVGKSRVGQSFLR